MTTHGRATPLLKPKSSPFKQFLRHVYHVTLMVHINKQMQAYSMQKLDMVVNMAVNTGMLQHQPTTRQMSKKPKKAFVTTQQ